MVCWPVTLGRGFGAELASGGREATVRRLSFEAITSFIAFEVTVRDRSEVFVLNLPLTGAPPIVVNGCCTHLSRIARGYSGSCSFSSPTTLSWPTRWERRFSRVRQPRNRRARLDQTAPCSVRFGRSTVRPTVSMPSRVLSPTCGNTRTTTSSSLRTSTRSGNRSGPSGKERRDETARQARR